jgi:hypothetical protein
MAAHSNASLIKAGTGQRLAAYLVAFAGRAILTHFAKIGRVEFRCFCCSLQRIISEQGIEFRRVPGPRAIRRAKEQQNVSCSAAVFRCCRIERTAAIVNIAFML